MCWFSYQHRPVYLFTDTVWHADMPTSLCLLSHNDSAKCHILGCGEPGVWPMIPKFKLRQDFCTMHLAAKFHHPTFNRLEVIVLTKRRRWKHLPHFAILCQWVIIKAVLFTDGMPFLADRTISRAFGTVSRLSVVCLSVTFCIVAKRCVLAKKCLKEWIGNRVKKFMFLVAAIFLLPVSPLRPPRRPFLPYFCPYSPAINTRWYKLTF